ncbi:ABC transporter [Microbacterium sp. NPDC096154]|uniref:ABC transporter n=1 Tax=Microbacterium sp. NPDC096154 TaxID=3155549 RepID=UPI00332F7B7F
MSDAQGTSAQGTDGAPRSGGRYDDENLGAVGNPDVAPQDAAAQDAAADAPRQDAAPQDAPMTTPQDGAATDANDVPATRREARAGTGENEVVATPSGAAPVSRPASDDEAPVEEPPAPPAEEPDYAALAADLDELESRGASTTVTTRSSDPEKRSDPWFEPADKTQTFTASDAYDAPAAEPRITASEPIAPETSATPSAPPAQLPVFVQAPEPPRMRGNRGAAGLIGLLAALVFAVLYFAATLAVRALNGEVTLANLADASLQAVASPGFWTTVVVFFLGFWLLGAIVNRARWAAWVLLGVFVGLIAYAGHILGALVDAPFWQITRSDGMRLVGEQLLSPLAIAAFVFGREITIWFGAWVARRGARVTERNAEAQAEYERTLEAGPQLS